MLTWFDFNFERKDPKEWIFSEHGGDILKESTVKSLFLVSRVAELDSGLVVWKEHEDMENIQKSQKESEREQKQSIKEDFEES